MSLDDFPATDAAGQAGFADRVGYHGGRLLKVIGLSRPLGIGPELALGDEDAGLGLFSLAQHFNTHSNAR